jgi:hypothetical protein
MKKFNLFIIACAVSFMGFAQVNATDPTVYAPITVDGVEYTFQNDWLVSSIAPLENFQTPSPFFKVAAENRNIVVKDGIVYFANRATLSLDRMDAKTGTILSSISFAGTDVFAVDGVDPTWAFNGLLLDDAGNLVTSNLYFGGVGSPIQVWVLDIVNPANSHMVLSDRLPVIAEEWGVDAIPGTIRIDFVGVYGNLLQNGMVMAANSNGTHIFYWNVENGLAEWNPYDMFNVDMAQAGMVPAVHEANFSTMPTVTPISEEFFWLNFNSQPLVMMNMQGRVVGSLFYDFENEGDVYDMGRFRAPQGAKEFELRGELFLILPYGNWTAGQDNCTFTLMHFDDDQRMFVDITPMWIFPGIGLGNVGTTATGAISVEVNNTAGPDYGTATIAIHVPGNGYGIYTLTSFNEDWVSTPEVFFPSEVVGMSVNGNVVTMDKEVTNITVFSVTGQQVVTSANATTVTIPAQGIFLVRATTLDGQTAVQRVIIR